MIKKTLPLIISMVITGCVAIPNIESPAIEGQTITSLNNQSYTIKREKWWTELNNKQLNQLMIVILDNNKDLKLLDIKIAKIQEQYQLNNANKKIGIDLEATANKQRLSGNSFNPAEYSNRIIDNDSLSLNANYDVDLFKKIQHFGNQYMSLQAAEKLNKQWSELNISNQVVKLYADFTFYNNQSRLLIEQKEIYQELLELEQYKVSIGTSIDDEVLKLKNNIKDMNTLIVDNTTSLQLTKNSLMLLGNNNDKINKILAVNTVDLYKTELKLPEYYTAEVITERPDVKYYLYNIDAQEEQLEALKADFYPNITITGTAGFESITPNLLLSKSSLFATISPTLKLPIFDSGRIKSNYRLAGFDLNTFIENYNKTISTALKDINDNVYKLRKEKNSLENSFSKYENKKTIFNNMSTRYKYGTISRYEFVQERDQLLSEERNNNKQLLSRFNQQIDLINALGGINIINQKAGA